MTGWRLRDGLASKEFSATEVIGAVFERIDQVEGRVRAYLHLERERALAKAKTIDERLARGENLGRLCGIPIAIKDNMCMEGVPTTCASRILENYRPPYTATVVEAVDREDAIVIGKTNLDEFAMGSSTENSGYRATRNPWDLERVPGGSSGGSAAAVAADMTALGLGSDTGGSIRQPAALCGVVGLKPTYGRVSRYGLVAFASSLDQIGPITKDVRDSALLMNVIGVHDPRDSTSSPVPAAPDYLELLDKGVKGIRIGVPKEYLGEGLDPEVETAVRGAADLYATLGAEVVEVSLPHTEYAVATYYIVATAEASSNLARYDGVHYGHRSEEQADIVDMYSHSRREGFGAEVKRRIMLGTYALSSGYYDAYYLKASRVRTLMRQDFDAAFGEVDAILCPTSPTAAFKAGERTEDPLQMYLSDVFTISANLAGIPGISIPCGFTDAGLPIGMQILGRPFEEATILQIAHAFESETDFHLRKPALE